MSSQPLAITSCGTKSFTVLNETYWVPRHPLSLGELEWLPEFSQNCRVTLTPFEVVLVRGLSTLLGTTIGKAGVGVLGDVAQVAHKIHHFVIAEQGNHSPAILRCIFLQSDKQIHDITRLGAAVQKVAYLHQGGFTPCPMV